MNVTKLCCASALLLGSSACFAGQSFEATPEDVSLRALFERWAQAEGKGLVWEAQGDAEVDPAALNSAAKLSGAANLAEALKRLNRALANANAENPAKPLPMQACIFPSVIVVRTVDQRRCGDPL